MHDKQSINVAIGGTWSSSGLADVTVNIDTEIGTAPAVQSPINAQAAGYRPIVTAASLGGTQYLGLTVTGTTALSKIRMLALRGQADRNKLE
jgi:hypothetical protein